MAKEITLHSIRIPKEHILNYDALKRPTRHLPRDLIGGKFWLVLSVLPMAKKPVEAYVVKASDVDNDSYRLKSVTEVFIKSSNRGRSLRVEAKEFNEELERIKTNDLPMERITFTGFEHVKGKVIKPKKRSRSKSETKVRTKKVRRKKRAKDDA